MLFIPLRQKWYALQLAPFWLQSLNMIGFINFVIFFIKISLFGIKFYYLLQIICSISIFLVTYFSILPYYTSKKSETYKMHSFFFFKYNLKFLCYNYVNSRWTWLFMVWSFLHSLFITIYTLHTWNCTTYVRISFGISFLFFIFTLLALKIQSSVKEEMEKNEEQLKINNVYNIKLNSIQTQQHPFHILPTSFWPFFTAYFTFDTLFFIVKYFHYGLSCYTFHHLILSSQLLLIVLGFWFWNIIEEANEGYHTKKVRFNLLHGFILFILSEVMLFFAIFWAFFHSSLAPTVAIYCMWPPLGIQVIEAWGLPFFNTILLVSSGISVTVSHRAILQEHFILTSRSLLLTLGLGFFFTFVQSFEYIFAPFSINDSIFGSTFFFSTGFHGLHVLIGSFMLGISLLRNGLRQFLSTQHIGFTTGIWYWHFVDIVWIFLFIVVYWWGA